MRWNQVRGRIHGEQDWHKIRTADESVCEHGETICDNCVNLGWSDDWELEYKEYYLNPAFGVASRWCALDSGEYPDPRQPVSLEDERHVVDFLESNS